ncbi:MAG: PaaI family thioesterase [Anaerolineae bacterium]|nr:PaaI family thioesterase [Anaerolineae bacterium]
MCNNEQSQKGNQNQQPSARWCFVCGVENPFGLKIRFFNDGYHQVLARVTLGDAYQSYPGIAHGGILATILDETMGRATLSTDDEPREITDERFMFTMKLETRYRKSVPLNKEFTVRARVDNDRGRMATASGEIVLADGAVAVEAKATLVDIPADQIDEMLAQTEAIGWQVYP